MYRLVTSLISSLGGMLRGQSPAPWFASAPVSPEYDPVDAMSTLARFPYIWVGVNAIASDMAAVPLIAVRRGATGRATDRQIVDDPALRLLEQPNATTSGYLFRYQAWTDYLLTGLFFAWHPTDVAMYRLHPRRVRVVPGPLGTIAGFAYRSDDGSEVMIPPDRMSYVRGPSWQDGDVGVVGESPIRCLHDDLTTDLGRRRTAAEVGSRRVPDLLLTMRNQVGPDGGKAIVERFTKAMEERAGAFVLGGEDVKATPLSWRPDELADASSDALRNEILAVLGVPPTRAGLTTASYGASRQESRVYWEGLIARARVFADAWSQLAQPGVRIEHDFSATEALQVSYTERLYRVQAWVAMGASPKAAAEYEGFDEAPVPEQAPEAFGPARPIDRQPEEPQDDSSSRAMRASVEREIGDWLRRWKDAAEAGVDAGLVRQVAEAQLVARLVAVGVTRARATWLASDLASVTEEATRLGVAEAFDAERAAAAADLLEVA